MVVCSVLSKFLRNGSSLVDVVITCVGRVKTFSSNLVHLQMRYCTFCAYDVYQCTCTSHCRKTSFVVQNVCTCIGTGRTSSTYGTCTCKSQDLFGGVNHNMRMWSLQQATSSARPLLPSVSSVVCSSYSSHHIPYDNSSEWRMVIGDASTDAGWHRNSSSKDEEHELHNTAALF